MALGVRRDFNVFPLVLSSPMLLQGCKMVHTHLDIEKAKAFPEPVLAFPPCLTGEVERSVSYGLS